jgi:hypothetical protein
LRPDKRKIISSCWNYESSKPKKELFLFQQKRHKVVIKIKIISKYILDVIPARFKYRKPGIAKKSYLKTLSIHNKTAVKIILDNEYILSF